MKPAITFFLSLCFLLCGGYNHLLGYSHQNGGLSKEIFSANIEKVNAGFDKRSPAIIRKAALFATDNEIIDAEEIDDDDEFQFSRKHIANTNYFLTRFSALADNDFYHYLKSRLPFCKHFSYTASSKYIVQRVIRI